MKGKATKKSKSRPAKKPRTTRPQGRAGQLAALLKKLPNKAGRAIKNGYGSPGLIVGKAAYDEYKKLSPEDQAKVKKALKIAFLAIVK